MAQTLSRTSLTDAERRVIARFTRVLEQELGPALEAVWLYGSRARGEPPRPESDVDLLVIAQGGGTMAVRDRVHHLAYEAALAEGAEPAFFSVITGDPAWLEQRRAIRAFFILDVDRDKVVIFGGA